MIPMPSVMRVKAAQPTYGDKAPIQTARQAEPRVKYRERISHVQIEGGTKMAATRRVAWLSDEKRIKHEIKPAIAAIAVTRR